MGTCTHRSEAGSESTKHPPPGRTASPQSTPERRTGSRSGPAVRTAGSQSHRKARPSGMIPRCTTARTSSPRSPSSSPQSRHSGMAASRNAKTTGSETVPEKAPETGPAKARGPGFQRSQGTKEDRPRSRTPLRRPSRAGSSRIRPHPTRIPRSSSPSSSQSLTSFRTPPQEHRGPSSYRTIRSTHRCCTAGTQIGPPRSPQTQDHPPQHPSTTARRQWPRPCTRSQTPSQEPPGKSSQSSSRRSPCTDTSSRCRSPLIPHT
mmetsp:Transcript_31305/g.71474  ORF Transcript_31305/g.71474 Transcript_31305/m.71474 type:complete len:262 (-) Transcript_31305:581-1366(-)